MVLESSSSSSSTSHENQILPTENQKNLKSFNEAQPRKHLGNITNFTPSTSTPPLKKITSNKAQQNKAPSNTVQKKKKVKVPVPSFLGTLSSLPPAPSPAPSPIDSPIDSLSFEVSDLAFETPSSSKEILQYSREQLISIGEREICKLPPNGRSPLDIIKEYDLEWEKKRAEHLAKKMSLLSLKPKKKWLPKERITVPSIPTPTDEACKKPDTLASEPKSNKEETSNLQTQTQQLQQQPQPQQELTEVVMKTQPDESEKSASTVEDEAAKAAHRLANRQKQIDYGKNTKGYHNYTKLVPRNKRKREDPKTPNKNQTCSKRSWDGQIRKWRRALHFYDDEELVKRGLPIPEITTATTTTVTSLSSISSTVSIPPTNASLPVVLVC